MLKKILILCLFVNISFAQTDKDFFLIARNLGEKVISSGDTIRVFGFAPNLGSQPSVPGPTIVANEGDSVHIDLWNVSQGAPHTIHLHGLDVDQQNDGVPHLSFDIPHMEHGYYHFKAPHPGTYLYHCHVASTIHVQAGMYGLIIIKPKGGENATWTGGHTFTNDYSFFCSEIDVNWHTDDVLDHEHDTSGTIHDIDIPKYEPKFFLINGMSDQQLTDNSQEINGAIGQVDYVRLTNIGFYGLRVIFPKALQAKIVSTDGRPLPIEENTDTVYVYPGERYGVLIEPNQLLSDVVQFEYFSLNTKAVEGLQFVPVNVEGYFDVNASHTIHELKLYPNPADQQLTLVYPSNTAQKLTYRFIDLNGKILGSSDLNLTAGENHVIINELPQNNGVYVLQLIESKGYTSFTRVVIGSR